MRPHSSRRVWQRTCLSTTHTRSRLSSAGLPSPRPRSGASSQRWTESSSSSAGRRRCPMSDEGAVERFDAVVIGLGVYGSAVAYELAMRGLRVLGVERSLERVVRGASQGPIRMVRGGVTRDGTRADLAREAAAWWRGFAEERGPELFRPARELSSPHAIAPASDTCSPPWTGLLDAAACVRALRYRAAHGGAALWFGCGAKVDGSVSPGN